MGSDDRQLVSECQAGSEEAYRVLLGRYEKYIYGLCFRFSRDPEDALEMSQEAMINVVPGLPSFHNGRPFKPWLRQVTVNTCINYLRCRSPDPLSLDQPLEGDLNLGQMLPDRRQDRNLEWMETRDALQRIMEKLPPAYRIVLILRHQEEMSYQEISDACGWPIGTVKTNLFRARSLLRQSMSELYGWEV